MSILNIAGYKFVPLSDLALLRADLLAVCRELQLKGTILLSLEGINLTLAGECADVESFKNYLKNNPFFSEMSFRESYSSFVPFKKMKIKLKKEIITMRCPEIQPDKHTAPRISPKQLKEWLDEERDFLLLDTRNDYEVDFGTFSRAKHFNLNHFCKFPQEAEKLERTKPIVMFCTGGVRCEKAGAYMVEAGFPEVYQLDGGILNYFSEVGGAHYDGECFVFDERVALDSRLQPKT